MVHGALQGLEPGTRDAQMAAAPGQCARAAGPGRRASRQCRRRWAWADTRAAVADAPWQPRAAVRRWARPHPPLGRRRLARGVRVTPTPTPWVSAAATDAGLLERVPNSSAPPLADLFISPCRDRRAARLSPQPPASTSHCLATSVSLKAHPRVSRAPQRPDSRCAFELSNSASGPPASHLSGAPRCANREPQHPTYRQRGPHWAPEAAPDANRACPDRS